MPRDDIRFPSSDYDGIPTQAMTILLETSRVLGCALELMDLMQSSVSSACEMTGLQTSAIYLLDGDVIHLQATVPPLPSGFPVKFLSAALAEHPHMKRCIERAVVIEVADVENEMLTQAERDVCDSRHLKAIVYVPIQTKSKVTGVLSLGTTQDESTNAIDVDTVQLSALVSHISLAISNAKLHATLKRANVNPSPIYDDALTGWADALNSRDHVTGGHSFRVEELILHLAPTLGILDSELEHVRRGVLLHDIGKMIVPDSVLLKAGPLSQEEWAVMRQHPKTARDFMSDIDFLVPAIDIPYCHHERWDGTGYPRGISGDEIPMSARIFAIVDVYDALISDRPYRKAWSKEQAITHITEGAGSHFDPAVVDIFLDTISKMS